MNDAQRKRWETSLIRRAEKAGHLKRDGKTHQELLEVARQWWQVHGPGRQMQEKVVMTVIRSLANEGAIDISRAKNPEEVRRIWAEWWVKNRPEIAVVSDHADGLLATARQYAAKEKAEHAILFYALWVEHFVNSWLDRLGKRKGLSQEETEGMIRNTDVRSKCSWLLRVLGYKALEESHLNQIGKLLEHRNAFVHYKWKPDNEQFEKEAERLLDSFDKTVAYLQHFDRTVLGFVSRRSRKLRSVASPTSQPA